MVNADGMLSAKFVTAKATGAQPAPDKFFRPRFLFAKLAAAFDVGHDINLENGAAMEKFVFTSVFYVRPQPDLLPRGEGTAFVRFRIIG